MRVAGSAAPPPKSEAGLGWLWTGERDTMYNVFRLTGDGLHCLALIVLFAKMNQTRSCAGGCAVFVPWRIALTACCKVLARAGWAPPPCAALTNCSWRLRIVPLSLWLLGAGVSLKTAYLYAMVFSCRCEPSTSSVSPDAVASQPTAELSALTRCHCHLCRPGPDHNVVHRTS